MVLGIGEGKITVTLEKSIYAPGETMRGTARIELPAPKAARALRLELQREEQDNRTTTRINRAGTPSTRKTVEFSKTLSGEKTYGNGEEFQFELLAPTGTSSLNLPPSPVSGIITALVSFAMPAPRYYVAVILDVPNSLDISDRVQIQLQARQQQ